MLRREGKVDSRTRRQKEIQDAIARRKEARQFVIEEKKRVSGVTARQITSHHLINELNRSRWKSVSYQFRFASFPMGSRVDFTI